MSKGHRIYKRNCNYCGKYYESFGQSYCNNTCGGLARRTRVQITCKECEKIFDVFHCRAKIAKFCSTSCSMKWQYKHDIKTRKKASIKISIALTDKKFTDEHKKNIGLAQIGKKRGPMPEKQKKKISQSLTGQKHTEKRKQNQRKARVNSPNRVFKDTKIELKIETELKKRNITYEKQKPLCNIARVDFLLPKYKIVIQCDGCFWHGCPIHNPTWTENKARDANQDKVLRANGYVVYRFWGHEINESTEKCINTIQLFKVKNICYTK